MIDKRPDSYFGWTNENYILLIMTIITDIELLVNNKIDKMSTQNESTSSVNVKYSKHQSPQTSFLHPLTSLSTQLLGIKPPSLLNFWVKTPLSPLLTPVPKTPTLSTTYPIFMNSLSFLSPKAIVRPEYSESRPRVCFFFTVIWLVSRLWLNLNSSSVSSSLW